MSESLEKKHKNQSKNAILFEMNLAAEKQENENTETFGFVRIKVMRGSCYGSPALTIELKFEAGDRVSAELSEGLDKRAVSLERAAAEKFLSEIAGIIEKPEVLSGLRHVDIRYHAEIEWENLEFTANKKSGKFKAFSDEWFVKAIELFLDETETAEITERLQKILNTNPHRHALEIYSTVKGFSRKYFM